MWIHYSTIWDKILAVRQADSVSHFNEISMLIYLPLSDVWVCLSMYAMKNDVHKTECHFLLFLSPCGTLSRMMLQISQLDLLNESVTIQQMKWMRKKNTENGKMCKNDIPNKCIGAIEGTRILSIFSHNLARLNHFIIEFSKNSVANTKMQWMWQTLKIHHV